MLVESSGIDHHAHPNTYRPVHAEGAFYSSPTPAAAQIGIHPVISNWYSAALAEHVVGRKARELCEPGTTVWHDPRNAVVPALFHPWQFERGARSYALARLDRHAGAGWLVTRDAFEAAKNAEGYVSYVALNGFAKMCSSSLPGARTSNLQLKTYERAQFTRRVTAEDLPDMFIAEIGAQLSKEKQRQIVGRMAVELDRGALPTGVTLFRNAHASPAAEELRNFHRWLPRARVDPFHGLPCIGREFPLESFDIERVELRPAGIGDAESDKMIRMISYVETYGALTGDPLAASEFICTHKVKGKRFDERIGGYLQSTIGQKDSYHSIAELRSSGGRLYPFAIGELAFREEVLLSGIYSLVQGQGVGTEMVEDFGRQIDERGYEGMVHLMVSVDPNDPNGETAAMRFYRRHGFRVWPKPTGGPVWQNGEELGQRCMSRYWGRGGENREFDMPADQTPPLSWDSDEGRLVYTRYIS